MCYCVCITICYIARTHVNHFYDYLMYVFALPIKILKHLFFTVTVVYEYYVQSIY